MAVQKVAKVGVKKEKGYLYFVDKHGDVSCAKMARGNKKGGTPKKLLRSVLRNNLVISTSSINTVTSLAPRWFVAARRKRNPKDSLLSFFFNKTAPVHLCTGAVFTDFSKKIFWSSVSRRPFPQKFYYMIYADVYKSTNLTI